MNWISLSTEDQIEHIKKASFEKPQVIFKHSITCSISRMSKSRLDREEAPEGIDFHYLDLLTYRPVSNLVADVFEVHHESPQVLLIKNGECVYDESHNGITMDEILEQSVL